LAILKDEPPAITTVQSVAPPALDHVVTTCLAKDPDERWQSAADIARELKWVGTSGAVAAVRRAEARPWRERSIWIGVATALVAALVFVSSRRSQETEPSPIARLSVNPPPGTIFSALSTTTVATAQFAMSPDGRSLALVASTGELSPLLWVRALDDVEARPIQGSDGAQEPFWSPDSQWLGFFDQTGAVKKVPVAGGAVQTIARGVSEHLGVSWARDGRILVGSGYGPIVMVSASGGETPRAVTELDRSKGEGSHRWPQLLPDGRHFLFTVRGGPAENRGVHVGNLEDSTRHLLIHTSGDAQFVARIVSCFSMAIPRSQELIYARSR
jgi:serine/threonine-protein kinase